METYLKVYNPLKAMYHMGHVAKFLLTYFSQQIYVHTERNIGLKFWEIK